MKRQTLALLFCLKIILMAPDSWAGECGRDFGGVRFFKALDLPPYVPFSSYYDPKKAEQYFRDNPTARAYAEGNRIIQEGMDAIARDQDAPVRGTVSVLLAMKEALSDAGPLRQRAVQIRETSAELSALYRRPIVHHEVWPKFLLMSESEGAGDEFKRVFHHLMQNTIERLKSKDDPAIFFDITGVNKSGAQKNMTHFEIQTLFSNPAFLSRTQFYFERRAIDTEEARRILKAAGWL